GPRPRHADPVRPLPGGGRVDRVHVGRAAAGDVSGIRGDLRWGLVRGGGGCALRGRRVPPPRPSPAGGGGSGFAGDGFPAGSASRLSLTGLLPHNRRMADYIVGLT